jgi:endonuclease YncB( thermonuclease family)
MRELTRDRTVECDEQGHDRYRRVVAVCHTEAGEINAAIVRPLLAHGYTVFAVVHGSQPRFQIPCCPAH